MGPRLKKQTFAWRRVNANASTSLTHCLSHGVECYPAKGAVNEAELWLEGHSPKSEPATRREANTALLREHTVRNDVSVKQGGDKWTVCILCLYLKSTSEHSRCLALFWRHKRRFIHHTRRRAAGGGQGSQKLQNWGVVCVILRIFFYPSLHFLLIWFRFRRVRSLRNQVIKLLTHQRISGWCISGREDGRHLNICSFWIRSLWGRRWQPESCMHRSPKPFYTLRMKHYIWGHKVRL